MEKNEIKTKINNSFMSGLHCAEAILKTIAETFSDSLSDETLRVASGFGGGVVGSEKELCGAFSGGIMAISYLLGRNKAGENLFECAKVVEEYKAQFLAKFGTLTCGNLIDGFEEPKSPFSCINLTADAAEMLATILKTVEGKEKIDFKTFFNQPRKSVDLGYCPFKGKLIDLNERH